MQALRITLPDDMARLVREKVASGEYASESDVLREGLERLTAQDAGFDRWLREDVVPTARRMASDPSEALSASEAWDEIERHMRASDGKAPS